ncbi:MAG: hypothetical protein D6796_16340, partial [Caldilineae bacterium]
KGAKNLVAAPGMTAPQRDSHPFGAQVIASLLKARFFVASLLKARFFVASLLRMTRAVGMFMEPTFFQ